MYHNVYHILYVSTAIVILLKRSRIFGGIYFLWNRIFIFKLQNANAVKNFDHIFVTSKSHKNLILKMYVS